MATRESACPACARWGGRDRVATGGGERSGTGLGDTATRAVTSAGKVLAPSEVAEIVLAAIGEEHFLILPHAEVLDMYRYKGADYDRWIAGMRRFQAKLLADG